MLLLRPIRKSTRGLVSYRAAIVCVAALIILLARSSPPSFPHTSLSLGGTLSTDVKGEQSPIDKEKEQDVEFRTRDGVLLLASIGVFVATRL
jgi:hypothetical protein